MIFKSQQKFISSLIAVRLLTEFRRGWITLIHLVRQLKWNCRELRFHKKCCRKAGVLSLGFSLAFPRNWGCLACAFPDKSPPKDGASCLSTRITSSWTSYTINYIFLFLINESSFRTHNRKIYVPLGVINSIRNDVKAESAEEIAEQMFSLTCNRALPRMNREIRAVEL